MALLRFVANSWMIQREAHLPAQRIQHIQLKRFRKLVDYVARYSPYYAEIIRTRHIDPKNCTPADFPILTKDEVIANFDSIVTDRRITDASVTDFLETSHNPNEKLLSKYYVVRTSGTSGTVGHYLYTEAELIRGLSPLTLVGPTKLGQRLAYMAVTSDHFAGVTMAMTVRRLPLLYKQLQTFDINEPFASSINQLNLMQPSALSGYASSIRRLAEAQESGMLHIAPRIIHSGGELLTERDKEYIQRIFRTPITNVYAASEHIVMGVGRDDLGGMYMVDSNLIFEPHAMHTIVTNLYNYTLPLIRYKMTDILRLEKHEHSSMSFHKVAGIIGRHEYSPLFINQYGKEELISSRLFDFGIRGVRRMQIHVLTKESFILKLCLINGLQLTAARHAMAAIETRLKHLLKEKLMSNVSFKIELVNDLPVDPQTGKFPIVVKA